MDKVRELIAKFAPMLTAGFPDVKAYLNFPLLFFGILGVVILFLVFYFKRHMIMSLFSLYFSILLAVLLPLENQVARLTSFSYGPLIGFSALFGITSFMLISIFSKRRLIRQDFSRFSLLLIAVGFVGLFISSMSFFAPSVLTASILREYEPFFDGSKMRTVWVVGSLGSLFLGSFLSKKK